jgi:hypothetical protein
MKYCEEKIKYDFSSKHSLQKRQNNFLTISAMDLSNVYTMAKVELSSVFLMQEIFFCSLKPTHLERFFPMARRKQDLSPKCLCSTWKRENAGKQSPTAAETNAVQKTATATAIICQIPQLYLHVSPSA